MCNVVGGWYRIWLEVATQQFIGLAKKAFQMRDLCMLAHDMDLKGGYIIYSCKEVIEAESIKFCITECGCIRCSIKCH